MYSVYENVWCVQMTYMYEIRTMRVQHGYAMYAHEMHIHRIYYTAYVSYELYSVIRVP